MIDWILIQVTTWQAMGADHIICFQKMYLRKCNFQPVCSVHTHFINLLKQNAAEHLVRWPNCHLLKRNVSTSQHLIQYLPYFYTDQFHIFMLGQIYSNRMKSYDVYVWCIICIQILIWSWWLHFIAYYVKEFAQIGRVLQLRVQSGFIKSDQTWRNSLILLPHSTAIPPLLDWIQLHL